MEVDGQRKSAEERRKILLFLTNNEILVWDKEDVMTLRRKYRIVGSFVGSLPSKPRQNLVFSLPFLLLPEEAKVLVDENVARIVESVYATPTRETVSRFQAERKLSTSEQMTKLQKLKEQKSAEFAEMIEDGRKKRKRASSHSPTQEKKQCHPEQKTNSRARNESGDFDIQSESAEGLTSDTDSEGKPWLPQSGDDHCGILKTAKNMQNDKLQDFGAKQKKDESETTGISDGKLSERCTEDMDNNKVGKESTLVFINSKTQLLQTRDIEWEFPKNEGDEARYKVFSDLWKKGYFITNGDKFGGDYLVYPGDPLRYHSHFVVKILNLDEKLNGLDLISVGRLGSTVRKTSVLASTTAHGKVMYTSVQWSGFS